MGEESAFADHMSDADALMWNIEKDPVLRTTIVAVALLDRAPEWKRMRDGAARALQVLPRLRQRVVVPPLRLGLPQWVDDPSFDLDYHLRRVAAPPPATFGTVLEMARVAAMEGFDRARPLWQFTLVEGLEDGRAALIEKVHHTVTDGVGGMRLYQELLDFERDAAPRTAGPDPVTEPTDLLDRRAIRRRALAQRRRQVAGVARGLPLGLARAGFAFVRDPAGALITLRRDVGSAARLLRPVSEGLSPVMRNRSLTWHFDAFDVPLEDLRRAAKAADASINDVYLAALTGGLARYHKRHGFDVHELRIDLPVNIREDTDQLGGNRFVPVRFVLPVDTTDTVERIHQMHRIVLAQRAEPSLHMVDALSAVLNALPTTVVTGVFGSMLKHVDFAASNVPGIPVRSYLAGAELLRHYAFAPPGGTAVNVALLSHVDQACIGINSDTGAVADPDVLLACIREGFDEVVAVGAEHPRHHPVEQLQGSHP